MCNIKPAYFPYVVLDETNQVTGVNFLVDFERMSR
jgi:hypothetical protein